MAAAVFMQVWFALFERNIRLYICRQCYEPKKTNLFKIESITDL